MIRSPAPMKFEEYKRVAILVYGSNKFVYWQVQYLHIPIITVAIGRKVDVE